MKQKGIKIDNYMSFESAKAFVSLSQVSNFMMIKNYLDSFWRLGEPSPRYNATMKVGLHYRDLIL